jgi:hypothetical protein
MFFPWYSYFVSSLECIVKRLVKILKVLVGMIEEWVGMIEDVNVWCSPNIPWTNSIDLKDANKILDSAPIVK